MSSGAEIGSKKTRSTTMGAGGRCGVMRTSSSPKTRANRLGKSAPKRPARGARTVVQISQTLQPCSTQGLLVLVRQFQSGDRQAARGGAVLPRFEQAAGTKAGQGARDLGCCAQAATALEPDASGADLDLLHQCRLAAKQVSAASYVQHQAVRRVQSDHGGEAPKILQHSRQQGRVGVRSVGNSAQGRSPRLRVSQGQAGR